MSIPAAVVRLIRDEQERQNGRFIPPGDEYLPKLERAAELVCHEVAGECLGFVFFYCNAPETGTSYITLLGVDPAARRRGVGTALVNYVLEVAGQRAFRWCRLEVDKDNSAAIRFYQRLGFEIVESRETRFLMQVEVARRHDQR